MLFSPLCFFIMCLLRLCFSKNLNSHWLPDDDAAAGRWLRLRPLLGTRKPWSAGVTLHFVFCILYIFLCFVFTYSAFMYFVFWSLLYSTFFGNKQSFVSRGDFVFCICVVCIFVLCILESSHFCILCFCIVGN